MQLRSEQPEKKGRKVETRIRFQRKGWGGDKGEIRRGTKISLAEKKEEKTKRERGKSGKKPLHYTKKIQNKRRRIKAGRNQGRYKLKCHK